MFVPVQMTDKMRERDQYQQDLAVESDSEDAVLEVIGDDEKEQPGNQRKGKEHSQSVEMQELTDSVGTKAEYQREKRPRPMDPFTSLVDKTGSDADTGVGQPKNKSKKLEAVIDVDSTSRRAGSDTEIGNAETALKKQRKETKVTT
ncbi:hypothetical protein EW145_g954 [Phellinidium pouzarii]|uniref:Uncharacterized protein n=1 Tax=Phellinidium pouzarii TaxID=167371 RepID=A0A4S4LI47_9AGAM|nr:hypothetical protein EW145_g954 [Phellinidium pouzarii]